MNVIHKKEIYEELYKEYPLISKKSIIKNINIMIWSFLCGLYQGFEINVGKHMNFFMDFYIPIVTKSIYNRKALVKLEHKKAYLKWLKNILSK